MSFYGPIQHRDRVDIQADEAFRYLADVNSTRHYIYIHHPGYDEKTDLLFTIYAPDHISGGLHFSLLMDACAIIADNRNDGWLATDRRGLNRVKPQPENVLASGHYWHHLPRKGRRSANWPVVTCFEDWKFPSSLPSLWTRGLQPEHDAHSVAPVTSADAVRTRDEVCRITAHYTGTQIAHIIPRAESGWFLRNEMFCWNDNYRRQDESLLEDQGNLMLLRSDVHAAFDNQIFVFYPKDSAGFYVHMMEPS
ncbi:hypothetical protein V1514DRAFT_320820 [Lipomyces japonicus]|uniref:uncharacterized protein n=1 Tax=Lipomyces japonicus TaxID=56871 RepID=UPI0034CE5379